MPEGTTSFVKRALSALGRVWLWAFVSAFMGERLLHYLKRVVCVGIYNVIVKIASCVARISWRLGGD